MKNTNTKTETKEQTIIRRAAKFSCPERAWSWRNRLDYGMAVVMGDAGTWLVVTNREAGILRRAGYEIARF